jgi:light-regulated signal transduction histidine kinase (bacteriophytochrome)
MNSVKRKGGEAVEAGAVRIGDRKRFCTEVADGLHALAQPLSILRSSIELIMLSNGQDCGRYLDLSTRQIDRAGKLFSSLQSLTAAELEPARCNEFDFRAMAVAIVDEWKLQVEGTGIAVLAPKPDQMQSVFGDAERADAAISALLETAAARSSPEGVVEVMVVRSEDFVEFSVRCTSAPIKRLSAADRLNLAVAKGNILSQQGKVDFCESPFRASIALPLYPWGAQEGESALGASCIN